MARILYVYSQESDLDSQMCHVHKMLARRPEQRPTMEEIKQEVASLRVGLGAEQ